MSILNKFHTFLIILCLSSFFTIKANYYTREIDITNDSEVIEVAKNLFFTNEKLTDQTGVKRDLTPEEYEEKLDQAKNKLLKEITGKSNIFLCISNKCKKICGILYCKYDHRHYKTVEYMESKVYYENTIKKYFSNNFTTIMTSMTQYAENFYKKLSMVNVVVHALSKENASFYSQHGYILLNNDDANILYYTNTEKILFALGLPFLIPFLPLYILYKMCDWGIYYKNL